MANEAQESSKQRSNSPQQPGSRRFRLAEIFAEVNPTKSAENSSNQIAPDQIAPDQPGNEDTIAAKSKSSKAQRRLDARASELGVKLPPVASKDVIALANRVYDATPRASVLRVETPVDETATETVAPPDTPLGFGSLLARSRARRQAANDPRTRERAARSASERVVAPVEDAFAEEAKGASKFSPSRFLSGNFSPNTLPPSETLTWNEAASEDDAEATHEAFAPTPRDGRDVAHRGQNPDMRANSMNSHPENDTVLYTELEQLRGGMEEMYRVMTEMQERGDAQDKVFNTLHAELQDYKNDFIYEHMKPVVRPLLFLFDHMEQFENELSTQRNPTVTQGTERRLLSPELMCENISFFREQLVEALRICEVTPMKRPEGEVDSRLHKVVDTVATDSAGHNMIQRVVRSGWYLNGRVFRPAEVVIGLARQ